MFEGFERKRFQIGDVEINAVVGGSGPPVLLLHGFPQTHAMWARVAPVLARTHRVVVSDLRGYGDSSKPAAGPDHANYAFRAMAQDQVAVMRALGHDTFSVIGHDRGGRAGHRMALDRPEVVTRLAVLDIVPTYAMLMDTNRRVAGAYWHWYFLSQPAPFPERFIAADPDYFFETSLVGWGASRLEDFDRTQLAEYRRCWRDPETIRGMCSDYRAAVGVDLAHDTADIATKVQCPVLAFWGSKGVMHALFDMKAEWEKRCARLATATLPGGHFFVDQFPAETAERVAAFLSASG